MSTVPTYPGVYIEEIPSTVRTIVGVPTAVAAFVGRAVYGPVNTQTVINSFADFERKFGGLSSVSPMSFAIRDFFQNGGSQAVIVRLYKPPAGGDGRAEIDLGNLKLKARDPGEWGNNLRVRVESAGGANYNLIVAYVNQGNVEYTSAYFVSSDPKAKNRVDRVLEQQSDLVSVDGDLATMTTPPAASGPAGAGTSGVFDDKNKGVSFTPGDKGALSDALQDTDIIGSEANKTGLYALNDADIFNLLCIPPLTTEGDISNTVIDEAISYCRRKRAMLLIDPPAAWRTKDQARAGIAGPAIGAESANAAIYFPRLRQPNPMNGNAIENFVPCGAVAGVIARTDADRGVWKAPAGLEATMLGVPELSVKLTDAENGELNTQGINCLRSFAVGGRVVWGARTRKGNDQEGSEWKYVPVRRLALFLEETLYRNTKWVVFEPNDEPLWAQIRLNIGAFLHTLFRKGAFQGMTPREAYFVKCDGDTTTQDDVNRGIVNIIVGFAPLKPAEFVIIRFQQMAGRPLE